MNVPLSVCSSIRPSERSFERMSVRSYERASRKHIVVYKLLSAYNTFLKFHVCINEGENLCTWLFHQP